MPNNIKLPSDGNENTFLINEQYNNKESITNANQALNVSSFLPNYTRGQKIGAIVLAFFAFFIIIAWFVQLRSGINREIIPVADNNAPIDNNGNTVADESAKQKDTDGDGLSDWDELNVYQTSPYLEDSDSDGYSDKEEAATNNDPNCPVNTVCNNPLPADSSSNNAAAGIADEGIMSQLDSLSQQLDQTGTDSGDQAKAFENILSGQSNVADLRKMLLESGMDEEMLKQITDEDLMKTYEEMLKE
ncbi:MAG: hypothetical protein MUC28_04035 [Planctomycetes bacterium]|jgi:hypothetical protein|nr:hypothetical protein [Planctomycetota bacterium]